MALRLHLLGPLQVFRDGARMELPPSKKTRALLAYLVITQRSHRRERLIDLLWDVADDPRGALRWTLSRLRKVVDEPGAKRIVADRDTVRFDPVDTTVDLHDIGGALQGGVETADDDTLLRLAAQLEPDLLDGLALEDFDAFQAWYLAERETVAELRSDVLRALVTRYAARPDRRLAPLRRLVQTHPLDEDARVELVRTLASLSRFTEARQQVQAGRRALEEVGRRPSSRLRDALQVEAAPAPRPPRPAPHPVPRPRLVGRGPELEAIARWHADADRPVLLVLGESGIGKTRFLDEVADRHDGPVLRAAGFEAEQRPWGMWRDALGSGGLDDLQRLLDGGPSSRDAITDSIATALATRSDLLVVLDDVQWCDATSAELLHAVQRRAPQVRLLLAARRGGIDDHEPLLKVLRGLRRRGTLRELPLGPLDSDDLATLVADRTPGRDPADVVSQAGGNPLYALELAQRDPSEALPATLADLIRDRLANLSPDAHDALRWAAILGASFSLDTLTALVPLDDAALLDALDELERHGAVEAGASDGTLRFTHGLLERAVYDGLSVSRRRLMHGRVASVLAERRDAGSLTELVRHVARAGDARRAAEACIRAGWAHHRLLATTEAATLAKRGLHFAEQLPEPDATERAVESWELLLASRRPEDPERAAGRLIRLGEAALDLGSAEHARLGFQLAAWVRWETGDFSDAHRQAMRAELVSRQGDGHAQAEAEAARMLWRLERDLPQAEALLLHATAEAKRQEAGSAALAIAWALLYLHRGFLDQAEESLEEARELARSQGNMLDELEALDYATWLAVRLGHLDRAGEHADALAAVAHRVRDGSDDPYGHATQRLVAWMRGDDVDPDPAIEALEGADPRQRRAPVLCRAAAAARDRGEVERARRWASQALDRARALERPSVAAFAATVLADLGDPTGLAWLDTLTEANRRTLAREVQDHVARHRVATSPTL